MLVYREVGEGPRHGPGIRKTEEEMDADGRIERARLLYGRAVFGGDAGALATAENTHGSSKGGRRTRESWICSSAPHDSNGRSATRGEGEALFWVGCFRQVVRQDNDAAVTALERSLELATRAGDKLTMSYALRHLGIAEHIAGRLDAARGRLEESVRLRREIGFLPGVAANLVGLAYIAAAQGRRDEALALVEEARKQL